jgi:hypothetical protein
MQLKNIVPWGRTLKEYKEMFLLDENDLEKKILGCGDGPASFNVEVRMMGGMVTSIDPTYAFTKEELEQRIDEVAGEIIVQVLQNQESFVWKNIKDVDELYLTRMGAMKLFLEDYEEGKVQGHYLLEMLPKLSFENQQFDLALSSHFLFLYSEHLDYTFHKEAILEMLRVAKEVRIFPLVTLENEQSPYVKKIMLELEGMGYDTQIVQSEYEFQKGADGMLKVVKNGIL